MNNSALSTMFVATLTVFAVGVACNSSELTRRKAKELIESSQSFRSGFPVVSITADEVGCGIREGFWTIGAPGALGMGNLYLTPKGSQDFSVLVGDPSGANIGLSKRVERKVVDITGITTPTGASDRRAVEFTWTWNWDAYPGNVKTCIQKGKPGTDRAFLKLYDDGWRLE